MSLANRGNGQIDGYLAYSCLANYFLKYSQMILAVFVLVISVIVFYFLYLEIYVVTNMQHANFGLIFI